MTKESSGSLLASGIDFFAGLVSGTASIAVGQPFDTVKVRLQTDPSFHGPTDCARKLMRREGFRAFFKGMSTPLITMSAVNGTIFSCYGAGLRFQGYSTAEDEGSATPLSAICAAGMFAGFVQTFILVPSDLIKCKLQVQVSRAAGASDPVYAGPLDCMHRIVRQNGLLGMYRGLNSTLLRETPSFGFYFVTYELVARKLSVLAGGDGKHGKEWWVSALAGGTTGALTWASIYPIDVAKSHIQTLPEDTPTAQRSMLAVFKRLHLQHGLGIFSRGLGTTMLRAFPANAILFPMYELTVHSCTNFAQAYA